MDHLPKKFGFTSIKTLIDWSIDEGNRLFAGTRHANTWVFYHDALSQWWEKVEGGRKNTWRRGALPIASGEPAAPRTTRLTRITEAS